MYESGTLIASVIWRNYFNFCFKNMSVTSPFLVFSSEPSMQTALWDPGCRAVRPPGSPSCRSAIGCSSIPGTTVCSPSQLLSSGQCLLYGLTYCVTFRTGLFLAHVSFRLPGVAAPGADLRHGTSGYPLVAEGPPGRPSWRGAPG